MELCLPLSEKYKMLSEMEKIPNLGEVLSVRDCDYLSRNLIGLNGMNCKLTFLL